ncbi:hypothetical protein AWH62_08985 [Maricaulis sp. W15]|nr:hypothetical protein AWH62_08985 [Maricaulis sp. W15]
MTVRWGDKMNVVRRRGREYQNRMTDVQDQSRPRGRPALAPEARGEALAAAGALLAEQGLKGMKARTIAERAGLSVGSIYKLFGDIDDLVRELNVLTYRDVALHHQAALANAGLDAGDVHGRLMVLARAYLDFIINNDARWRALLTFNRRNSGEAPRYYTQHEDELFHIITDVLEPAPGLDGLEARETAARAIWAAVHGIIVIVLPNARYADPVATAMAQIEMIVGAFIRDAAARR